MGKVWVNSGSWWWTGRPGVLRSLGSQRVRHDRATELNWTDTGKESQKELIYVYIKLNHFAVHLKVTQHCKSTTFQLNFLKKQPVPKIYVLYDFIYMTFSERQNHSDWEHISGYQWLDIGKDLTTKGCKGAWGLMELFYVLIMVLDEWLYAEHRRDEFYYM